MKAKDGSLVKVHYRGTLEDGEEFDRNLDGDPLEFRIGEGQVIDGFERNVVGLAAGDRKTFTIAAEDAYGARDESLIMEAPKSSVPADGLFVGIGVQIRLRDGQVAEGQVTAVGDDTVTLDFNHPLAGKALTFAITVVAVE